MALKGEEREALEGALKEAKSDLRDGKVEAMAVIVIREGSPKGIDCSTGVITEADPRAKAKMAALLALQVKKICLGSGVDFKEVTRIADAIMRAEIEDDMEKGKKR